MALQELIELKGLLSRLGASLLGDQQILSLSLTPLLQQSLRVALIQQHLQWSNSQGKPQTEKQSSFSFICSSLPQLL